MTAIEGTKQAKPVHQNWHFWKFLKQVFIESAQRTPTQQAVSARHKGCAHHPCHLFIDSTVLCVVLHTVHGISKVQLLLNAFGVFRAFYRGHFSHDLCAQDVTLKSKALATKCIFQNYSQLLDICTLLIFKTAEEPFVPRVGSRTWSLPSQYR